MAIITYRQWLKSNAKLSLATSGLSTQQICPTAAQVVCIQRYLSSDICSFIISSVNKGDAKLEWLLVLYSGGSGPFIGPRPGAALIARVRSACASSDPLACAASPPGG